MFKNLSIFQKLVISYLALGWMMLILASAIYYQAFKTALLERTLEQLSSINILKKIQLEEDFQQTDSIDYSAKHIQFILQENTGIGNTGESYLVDKNHIMQTSSRFSTNNTRPIVVNTESVKRCFENGESKLLTNDYRNVPVLSIGRIIDLHGKKELAIITEIDVAEAMTPVYKLRNYILLIVLISSILISLITLWMAGKLSKPILQLKAMIDEISNGRIPSDSPEKMGFKELEEMRMAMQKLMKGFVDTTVFAHETGNGNFEAEFTPLSSDDILGLALIQMRNRLKELSQKELSAQRQRSAALLEGQEKERERISLELHDGLGQLLTGIKLMLENAHDFEQKKQIRELLSETIQEVRRISQSAMPPALMEFGLEAALHNLVRIMSVRDRLELELDYDLPNDHPTDFESRICLYRIAQEAINNMVKYSEASRCLVQVYLEESDEIPTSLIMRISDNGKGFNKERNIEKGRGLRNMKERAAIINGFCEIKTNDGKGTEIVVSIPYLNEQ